jgi:hypothetical protein
MGVEGFLRYDHGINFSDLQSALSIYGYRFVDSCGIMDCGTSGDPKIGFELEAGTPKRSHTVIAWINLYEDKPDKSGYMMFDQHFKFRNYLVSKYGEDNIVFQFNIDVTPEDTEIAWELYKNFTIDSIQLDKENIN